MNTWIGTYIKSDTEFRIHLQDASNLEELLHAMAN